MADDRLSLVGLGLADFGRCVGDEYLGLSFGESFIPSFKQDGLVGENGLEACPDFFGRVVWELREPSDALCLIGKGIRVGLGVLEVIGTPVVRVGLDGREVVGALSSVVALSSNGDCFAVEAFFSLI